LAAARAIQYARSLMPEELRAVHFIIDDKKAEALAEDWRRLGLSRVPLDLRECADRVIPKAAIEVTAEALADGDTEVSVLLPHRKYRGLWHRILHDQTADKISAQVSRLPHANVTLVPFHLGDQDEPARIIPITPRVVSVRPVHGEDVEAALAAPRDDGTTPIGFVRFRQRATVRGKVRGVRVQPLAGTPTLECVLADETGQLSVVFLGRRHVAGVSVGRVMVVTGVLGQHHGRLCFINPTYELVTG
jgi:hypothetical protein